jgi:hypothetical protein
MIPRDLTRRSGQPLAGARLHLHMTNLRSFQANLAVANGG